MDTYLPMSSNPGESETMIYLRDTLPSSHPETPLHRSNMIMYMNFPSSSGQYPDGLAENPGARSSCVDIASGSNSSQQEVLLNFGGSRGGESHMNNNAWGTSGLLQGLSLSLGPHTPSVMQLSNMEYPKGDPNFTSVFGPDALMPGEDNRSKDMSFQAEDDLQNKQLSDISTTYDVSSIGRSVPDSKYLKAAQQLLDEVVNVKKANKEQNGKKELKRDAKEAERDQGDDAPDPSAAGVSSVTPKASGNTITEPSGYEKKELHSKLTTLLALLDEVDRRYREYYHQMQLLVSSFDVIAGSGAAKPYTSLALHIISRQFLCLRDAINGQVHLARRSLGDEDASSSDRGIGISRLRYVDQKIRQQRAFQQLGMMQHQHSWRPQRGLPETCVSILRAWLFEHFLHPYPKDSEKIMLARQTGLTRSQVSNWFINARVRLWKPMVEEIYKEETGEFDRESNSSPETTPRATKAVTSSPETKGEDPRKGTSPTAELPLESKSDNMNTVVEITGSSTSPIFQHAGQQSSCLRETRGEDHQTCSSSLFAEAVTGQNCGSQRFITAAAGRIYGVPELDRYGSMNGVSLTLGLQRCDGGTVTMMDGTSHGIIPLRENSVYNSTAPAMVAETASEFDCIDSQNQPNQFVSSLLPSFT